MILKGIAYLHSLSKVHCERKKCNLFLYVNLASYYLVEFIYHF